MTGYRAAAVRGAIAGLAGGVVFGAAMAMLGMLPTIAALVRVDSAPIGFAVHMAVAALVGALFGILMAGVPGRRLSVGDTLFWGLTYGALWWYVGALTLLPLLLGESVRWTVADARTAFPSLVGHLLYGATAAVVYAVLPEKAADRSVRSDTHSDPVTWPAVIRGGVAGVASVWLLTAAAPAANEPLAVSERMSGEPGIALAAVAALGLLSGIGYVLLHPAVPDALGPWLIRGAGFGFLLWAVLGLTAVPLAERGQLAWTVADVRALFPALPAYLLLGALTAAAAGGLGRLGRLLFSGPAERADSEGVGARSVRAIGRGAVAGCLGGLLFTVVMVQIAYLDTVARLVGSDSVATGVVVHLTIAVIVGVGYGLLFRRQTHDLASALGWGSAYGMVWWVLGALTLLPVWLGGSPQWTATAAAAAFPSLVGHLAYGAGLGVTFFLLEARHDPWWVPRTAAHRQSAIRRAQMLAASAPGVWVLVVLMTLTLTVVLGGA